MPYVEIKLELFCNMPEVFLLGGKSTAKHNVTLTVDDLKVKLYLCLMSLNASVYNTLKENGQLAGQLARYS